MTQTFFDNAVMHIVTTIELRYYLIYLAQVRDTIEPKTTIVVQHIFPIQPDIGNEVMQKKEDNS